MMPDASPTLAAERQRRYRARLRRGSVFARAEVPAEVVEALVDRGLLPKGEATEPARLGEALVEVTKKLLRRNARRFEAVL